MMERKLALSKFDSIEAVTNQALDSLNRMRLSDAEDLYLRLIQHIKELDNNKKSLVKCYEGLADVYLKHSSQLHMIDKLEWQWMNIQAIILLQHAVRVSNTEANKCSANDDSIWFCDKRDSIGMKFRFQQERLMESLKESILFEERPGVYASLYRILSEGNDKPVGVGGWLDKLQTYCKNRLEYGASNMGRVIEIAEPKIEPVEKKVHKTVEYFRERYHKLQRKFLFHSPGAIKYGLNRLDRSRSTSCLDQYHNYNTAVDIQNQNCTIVPKRPQSLNVTPIIKPSSEQQIKKAVDYLKKKADTLKKRFLNTPVVSWQGIIDQHQSILDETLDDFKVDYSFANGVIDENDNGSGSDNTTEESQLYNSRNERVSETSEIGNYVNHTHSFRTKGDNVIEYDEDSIVVNPIPETEPDTGFCRDRIVNPLAFTSSKEGAEVSRGEKRNHGEYLGHDGSVANSNCGQYSHGFSYQQTVFKEGEHMTEMMRKSVVEYEYDSIKDNKKGLPSIGLSNNNSEIVTQSEPILIGIETLESCELKVEQVETGTLSPLSAIRKLGKYESSKTLPIEDLSPHELRTYRLATLEECSPVTETSSLHFDLKRDLVRGRKTESGNVASKSLVLPINNENIQVTLAHSILLMADNMFNQGLLGKASSVYEKALGLFHTTYKEGGLLDEKMAYILKKLGVIRTRNCDIIGGVGLMEQAMRMMNFIYKTDVHIRIAEIWYEMGNAYIIEHQHGETLRDHVILTIRDELNAEILDFVESDEEWDEEAYDGRDNKNSYSISTYEALTCYQHAFAILKDLQSQDKIYTDLMAKVLTKLGDCSVMTDNYDRAVQYYEKSLSWFPNARERSSLPSNAHVICMLGVVRFLAHRYAKAGAMFQCAHLMYQHINVEKDTFFKFEIAYVLSLLSFSHYATRQYYKATASALRAIDVYTEMYKESIPELAEESFWLINQTIYTLGYAYLSVDSYERALQFLQLAREYSSCSPNKDRVQVVQTLKAIGDCYEGMEKHEVALQYYCLALRDNEENGKGGMKSSSLQNLLLSKTARMHVSMYQYEEAAERLGQARDVQIDMEDDIRGDLVSLMHQLGQTHTLACEVDKAMECYLECIEAYEEDHDSLGPEMSATYGNLATLCHVKACMTECGTENEQMLYKAENYYQIAVDLEFSSVLALKYANYLFHQRSYVETILIVQQLLNTDSATGDVIFSGIEQVVAPELIQLEIEEEEIIIPASVFAKYLLVVSYRHLGQLDDAEYYVTDLMDAVYVSDSPLLTSILGYCILELGVFSEARVCFERAIRLSRDDHSVALRMCCFCLCLELYQFFDMLLLAQFNIFEYYNGKLPYFLSPILRRRRLTGSSECSEY
ncbi:uncharacterized protein LOC135499890 [Lineus longissimus]|uniref:uncharacterized protein LOC135499890 n=1 Tax=Lineus longissimus TaxID=88925 RepID=UPI00315DF342